MTTRAPLSPSELEASLDELEGWTLVDDTLQRQLKFATFGAAFAFMTQVALEAHRLNHHPTWTNSFNRLSITLVTHSAASRITALDVQLARHINKLLETAARD